MDMVTVVSKIQDRIETIHYSMNVIQPLLRNYKTELDKMGISDSARKFYSERLHYNRGKLTAWQDEIETLVALRDSMVSELKDTYALDERA